MTIDMLGDDTLGGESLVTQLAVMSLVLRVFLTRANRRVRRVLLTMFSQHMH